jgi:ankyrin repeat protein
MTFQLNLEQLRKQAKERVRERRAAGAVVKLADVQSELARELGFASWPTLKAYVQRLALEQPYREDLEYYEDRADGIASVMGVSAAEARRDLAARHGFSSWGDLRRHVRAMRRGNEPPTPFVLAYRAVEANDRGRLVELLDRFPDLLLQRGTNGNDLLGMAGDPGIVALLLERGADPNRGNDYGWTKLHQAGYGNDCDLARLMLAAGARADLSARGDGGTPLVMALFWGHREVAELLGRHPRNLRVAAGLGDLELIHELARRPQAGAHRGFYRPHGGFPAWQPSDDPQEVRDEALVWAAKADRVDAIRLLVELGARVDADPYRGTPLTWAAANGRVASIRALVGLGADPNQRGTFGGPSHGDGVTAIHLAAQSGQRDAVASLLELGADPRITDNLHGGDAPGWAHVGGHEDLAEALRAETVPPSTDHQRHPTKSLNRRGG